MGSKRYDSRESMKKNENIFETGNKKAYLLPT